LAFRTSLRNHAIARLRCRSFEAFRAVFAPPMQASAPDLIHCHDSMPLLAAQRTAQLTGAALIYDSHELEAHRNIFMPSYLRAKIMDVEARILPKADGVITVSDCFADDLAQMYSIARPHVVHNAPPLKQMALQNRWQAASRTSGLREEAGVSESAKLLVYTGNIGVNRGIEHVVAGLAEYYRRTKSAQDVHFSIVGSPKDDTAERVRIQAAAAGLADKIHFHAPVPPTEVTSFIAQADISVVSVMPATRSYDRTMPNKIFEAAMAGLPILGSNLTAQGAFIKEHALGLTYDPYDANSFCLSLSTLLETPDVYKRTKTQQKTFDAAFSWEAQGRKLTDLYARIAEKRGREIRRVCMVVPNPCNPDFRVVKEAQTLASAGYEVTLFATRSANTPPASENHAGVQYQRIEWDVRAVLRASFRRS